MVDVKNEYITEDRLKIILTIHETHILKNILDSDIKCNGRFKQDLLYYLNQYLKEFKEEKERDKKEGQR